MIPLLIGLVLLVCGGGCRIAEAVGGPHVFDFPSFELTHNIFILITYPIQSMFFGTVQEINKYSIHFIWYGILLILLGIVLQVGSGFRGSHFRKLSSFLSACLISIGLTGIVLFRFAQVQPQSLAETYQQITASFIVMPWKLLGKMQHLAVAMRIPMLISGLVMGLISLAAGIGDRFCDSSDRYGDEIWIQALNWGLAAVFTLIFAPVMIKAKIGLTDLSAFFADSPISKAFSENDCRLCLIISIYLLLFAVSFCYLRTWRRYRYCFFGTIAEWIYLIAAPVLFCALAYGVVYLLCDMAAVMLGSLLSTILTVVVCGVMFAFFGVFSFFVGNDDYTDREQELISSAASNTGVTFRSASEAQRLRQHMERKGDHHTHAYDNLTKEQDEFED